MKKIFLILFLFILFVCPVLAIRFISIATGGTGGTYYPLGGGMASILNDVLNIRVTAEVTGASVENIRLVQNREVEIAFVQNDITFYAATGTELFKDEIFSDVRGIATLYPEVIQILTLEKNGIDSVKDFAGRKIAVGAPGSGTEANARQIINAHGLSYDDMSVDYLSFSEAVAQLKDGHVDAAFLTGGTPTAAVIDLAATHNVKLLSIAQTIADNLIEDYPFYTRHIITANTYSGVSKDVETVSVQAMLITNANLSEKLVYDITKTIFENLNRLAAIHTRGADVNLATAKNGMSIQLHQGAKKFFEEQMD